MKDPEQVRRIEGMATVCAAVRCAHESVLVAGEAMAYALPSDHPAYKALLDATVAVAKAKELVAGALERFKR